VIERPICNLAVAYAPQTESFPILVISVNEEPHVFSAVDFF